MLEGGESPLNGRDLGKRTRGMLGPRVGGEGMGSGNGESIITNIVTRRHTNSTETNERSAFLLYHTREVHMYPHV